ncbi:hypothetical protein A0H81_06819 [Grifola frondosa]|uniref:Rieske domain-containing protein n=1 Tax=Grifola frondosa TaxID=5627 RepID=A0A1C7MA71_GRIFR|nr:hypothetical protein A0H81_06819 [Grifola frondosa]
MESLLIAPFKDLTSHSRFLITLRSQEGLYHSLILFRLSKNLGEGASDNDTPVDRSAHEQLYAMEANCPHLGADLSHAEIEECETGLVAVCPWHRYDFDLRTGHSETGLKACTYNVEIRIDDSGVDNIWVQTPEGGSKWRLVELRPVSEEFADPPPDVPDISRLSLSSRNDEKISSLPEELVPIENPPTTLMQWAVLILNTANPTLKVQRTRHAVHLFRTGQLKSIGHRSPNAPCPPDMPPREDAYTSNIVEPGKVAKRKNRAIMLHALANIEQWAIDLAWDIMARYGPRHPELPPAFFSDFTKMALDESKHFSLLIARLAALSPGTPYGSLPVHASLWESAKVTFPSLRSRLAIIHLVHEARESVEALEVIHHDEVTHVTTGHRWFTWLCARDGVDPVQTFREEVRNGWRGDVKGPFNVDDRETAGLTRDFYEDLKGEIPSEEWTDRKQGTMAQPGVAGDSAVEIGYEVVK